MKLHSLLEGTEELGSVQRAGCQGLQLTLLVSTLYFVGRVAPAEVQQILGCMM